MIRRNVELEARLIDDLLDLTRVSQGKLRLFRQKVDLHHLLGHVIEMCASELHAKQLQLTQHTQSSHCEIDGDPARMQQVLWNLIKNAIKFTPQGGTITVRSWCEGEQFMLSVCDTGIGLDPQILPRLFNAFEQGSPAVTRQFGGLGLGLASPPPPLNAFREGPPPRRPPVRRPGPRPGDQQSTDRCPWRQSHRSQRRPRPRINVYDSASQRSAGKNCLAPR